MNLEKAQKLASAKLKKADIKTASLDALILLSLVLKKEKEYILTHPEQGLIKNQQKQFLSLLEKRSKRFPLAYLTGEKEFFGYEFLVNKSVLIPRPETEQIIELALKNVKENKKIKTWKILDIGTGSGCITISLAKELKRLHLDYKITASDISASALKIAKTNAKNLKTKKIIFIRSDLFKNINGKFNLILANLPYVKKCEIENELKFEPILALEDKNQIKKFLTLAPKFLEKNGLIIYETKNGKIKIKKYSSSETK